MQNHPKCQICPVLTVGWPMLPDFVVEGWKSDFCDSSSVKIGLFPILINPLSAITIWSTSKFHSTFQNSQKLRKAQKDIEENSICGL